MRIYRYIYRYYGSFNRTVEGDIELPSIDADKTLAVEFRYYAYRYMHRYIRYIYALKAILSTLLCTLAKLSQLGSCMFI